MNELDRITVASATAGYGWEMGRSSGDTGLQPALFQPDTELTAHIRNSTVQLASLTTAELESCAQLLYGDDRLRVRFADQHPANPKLAAYWLAVIEMALMEARSGALENPLLRVATYWLLAVAVLESFKLEADRPALHTSAERTLQVYRTASQFLEDYASLPVTIDDAARAADASIHELVLAFRWHSPGEISPTTYLRHVRLRLARDELAQRPPSPEAVEEVARRWGFLSPKRFRYHYRTAFGTEPQGPTPGR